MNRADKLRAAFSAIRADLGSDADIDELPDAELRQLAEKAADAGTLKRWLKRRLAGESIAYILGGFLFDRHWFAVDARAYVTDPELIHLVDLLTPVIHSLQETRDRPPLIAELGVGCGSLALSLKHRLPSVEFVGLDLDPGALAVAAGNARSHRLSLRLVESDLFDSWPADLPAPDLIYSDPPWGDEQTLYGEDRPAAHYSAMPAVSAFALGGRTGAHSQILRAVRARGWASDIWLNCGVLDRSDTDRLGPLAERWQILHPRPDLSIFQCQVVSTYRP